MSREFQPIIRVEGKKFAPPQPQSTETTPEKVVTSVGSSSVTGIPEAGVLAAIQSAQVSYPTRSQEVVKQALETALPLLRAEAKKAGSLRVDSISEEVVEATAEAIYSLCGSHWEEIGYRLRWIFRDDARAILEAVTPHIQFRSAFWDDLTEDLKDPEFAAEYAKITAEIQEERK